MNKTKVIQFLRSLLSDFLVDRYQSHELFLNTVLKDLSIPSFEQMRIIIEIENHFDLEFDDDHLNLNIFYSLEDICNYIVNRNSES